MKGVSGNPALDAYQRMAVSPVNANRPIARPQAPGNAEPGSDAAQVKISSQARDLAMKSSQKVDTQKVEALKARIQAGTFHVNPAIVAEKLLHTLG